MFKKKILFFCLEDVLIPGLVDNKVDVQKTKELLGELKPFEEKGKLKLFLISGNKQTTALQKIKKHGIGEYFQKENIFAVTRKYIDSKKLVDKNNYIAQLKKNKQFKDEYLKQIVIQNIAKDFPEKEEMVLIGHDFLTDGYYTTLYSKIDVVFASNSASYNHQKCQTLKGMAYADLNKDGFQKVLNWQYEKIDYSILQRLVFSKIGKDLFQNINIGQLQNINKTQQS